MFTHRHLSIDDQELFIIQIEIARYSATISDSCNAISDDKL